MLLVRFATAVVAAVVCLMLASSTSAAEKTSAPTTAAAPAHPVVLGFGQLELAEEPDAIAEGTLLVGELNCLSCHKAAPEVGAMVSTKQAPLLGEVATRVDPKYLLRFIADTHGAKPGTTMPAMIAAQSQAELEAAVEPIVHYLASLSKTKFARVGADFAAVSRGEVLFHEIGCIACHTPRREGFTSLESPTITISARLADKYSISSLATFLSDPLKVRPSGRMPHLNLTAAEANDLAHYLLKETQAPASLNVQYYEGSWGKLPDFAALTAKGGGGANGFSLGVHSKQSNFALQFTGFLQIAEAGDYTFHVMSDDGSRLEIDNKVVVNNDGQHPPQTVKGTAKLSAGLHPIRVLYMQGGGGAELQVDYEGPGVKRQQIPSSMLVSTDKPIETAAEKPFTLDPLLAEIGAESFAKIGCANCHDLGGSHKKVASQLPSKPLGQLKTDAGCLSPSPAKGVPNYHLSARQTAVIQQAIKSLSTPQPAPTPKQRIAATMATLNCYACHQRDGFGGVPRDRDALFVSDDKDLGDEGRIPPLLTGVGDKLQPTWLAAVVQKSGIARPYMHTRMPQFGEANLNQIAAHFVTVDLQPDTLPKPTDPVDVSRKAGHQLVGKNGLSCISCHMFNRRKSLGIQAMDLSTMAERLRPDWFYRYMQNPAVFRPGTRMPQAFINGKSTRKDILEGSPDRQIAALWTYLSDGRKARDPEGLTRQAMELIVGGEALMYRNFIDGGGTRAIGVGYPEEVNLAFDANQMRVAMIWTGRFMDASRHWNGRGDGAQPPAGDNVVKLVDGPPLAILENATAAWPTKPSKELGFKFRGYRLDSLRRPTFTYLMNNVSVDEFSTGAEDAAGRYLVCTLTLTSPEATGNLWARFAAGGKIEPGAAGEYKLNDQITLRFKDSKPQVRKIGDSSELVVPVEFAAGKATITVEYHW